MPRILIFGQSFSESSGGGITLTNLFKGWPKDSLASTFIAWENSSFDTNICDNYYVIGSAEHRWMFPLNLMKKPFPDSGPISIKVEPGNHFNPHKPFFRGAISNIINPILRWMGFYHLASNVSLSGPLKTWIRIFNPELLYLQVSTLEGIDFACQLIEFCSVPTVLHMMDDWLSTLGRNFLLLNYWNKRVNRQFLGLLKRIDLCLAISDAMAIEYEKRYGRRFVAFHNPVEIGDITTKDAIASESDILSFRVLYVGRIGTANRQSIISFAKAISGRNSNGKEIKFDLFSKDFNERSLRCIKKLKAVRLNKPVSHDHIPALLSEYDLLLLPLDFTANGIRFSKLSMPSKAAEYMASGTPILVLAPRVTAILRFFIENDCGFTITRCSPSNIRSTMDYIVENKELRKQLSKNAINIAKEKFEAGIVRTRFQDSLVQLLIK